MERGTRDWKDLRVPKNELGRVMFLEIGKAMDLVVVAAAAIEEMRVVEVAEQAIFLGFSIWPLPRLKLSQSKR